MLDELQSTSIIPPPFDMKISLVLALLTAGSIICEDVHHNNYFLSDDFINQINSANLTWTAKRNFHPSTSLDTLHSLVGVLPHNGSRHLPYKKSKHGVKYIPEQFNARDVWPECPSIGEIFNQGPCGSCWACGSATTITDRLCIHSKGDIQVQVSAQNLLSCAPGNGCRGGPVLEAWEFWVKTGLVSGGPWGSGEGCQPYKYGAYKYQPVNTKKEYLYSTPECHKYCENPSIQYDRDKTYGNDAYMVERSVEEIQQEIMENGPVVATFYVYDDFYNYDYGVYKHDPRFPDGPGPHAVRLLGWGEENGTPYWLAANTWGHKWGDQGLFKIIRGEDHCEIERWITAGLPRL